GRAMADYDFDKPVRVIIGIAIREISDTRQASETLMFNWPIEGGKKHKAARHALLVAMGSDYRATLIKAARNAFAEAAAEADVLVPD
ncbi:DUF982 domain-containing protein, partial [Rhizobiaceae sp. 2RAB30]